MLVYLWLTKKFSHQACDIGSQPGLCGMVELHTASNAKYIGMTQTIVEPRRENSSILILVRHDNCADGYTKSLIAAGNQLRRRNPGRRHLAAQPRGHAVPDGVARQLPATLLISDGSARHSLP